MEWSWVSRPGSGQFGLAGLPKTLSSNTPTLDMRISRLSARMQRSPLLYCVLPLFTKTSP